MTTGAPVPPGYVCVVPIEDIDRPEEASVCVKEGKAAVKMGQFIRAVGSDIGKDMLVLKKGQIIRAPEIGLLATVGKVSQIKVQVEPRKVRIGILSSGNELVPASTDDLPPGKIRDSNKNMLMALAG